MLRHVEPIPIRPSGALQGPVPTYAEIAHAADTQAAGLRITVRWSSRLAL